MITLNRVSRSAIARVFYGATGSVLILQLVPSLAEANTSCGKVEVAKGDVKIQSGTTKQIAPANVGASICSGDTIIAANESRAKLRMPDGNELNISPNSKILIENYQFNPADNKKKVLLNILQGKVRATTKQENMYNDKDKNGQANTFQIRTKSAVAGVRGTDFLTSFDPSTQKSEVVTFKGKVEFGQPGPNGGIVNSVQVGAGFKTEMRQGQPPAPPSQVPAAELNRANSETKADVASGPSADNSNNANQDSSDDKKDAKNEDKNSSPGEDKKSEEPKKEVKEEKKADEPKKEVAEEKKSEEPKKEVKEEKKAAVEEKKSDEPKKGAAEEKKADEPKKVAGEEKKADDSKRAAPAAEEKKSDSRSGSTGGQANQSGQRPAQGNSSSNSPGNATAQQATTTSVGAGNRSPAAAPPPSAGMAPPPTSGMMAPTGGTTMPTMPSGSMLDSRDLAGGAGLTGPALPTIAPGIPTVYVPPPPPIIQPTIPTCDLCNQVIQSGPSKLIIRVQTQ